MFIHILETDICLIYILESVIIDLERVLNNRFRKTFDKIKYFTREEFIFKKNKIKILKMKSKELKFRAQYGFS